MSRTIMFGKIDAFLLYNIFSRIIDEMVCRLFGIPTIRYFDDFGALFPAGLARHGVETYAKWCELPGITHKLK